MKEYAQRLAIERDGLVVRLVKLKTFITTVEFLQLPPEDAALLILQLSVMESYQSVLSIRIQRAIAKGDLDE